MQSHRKKILLWFTTFALIMACVPSVATPIPVPTLNANAIETYIIQTANVASTGTAAAIPIIIPTNTLRNTFTPESTYTAVGTIIFDTPVPIAREQYFRVKHDTQLAEYNYKSRSADPNWPEIWGSQTPEVVRLSVTPKNAAGTHRTTITAPWEAYMDALNNYEGKKLVYLKGDATAIFDGNGFPQMESMTMGGNIIVLDEIKGTWGRVHTMDYGNPGEYKTYTYFTRPDLVHKFVVVVWSRAQKASYWVNPPPGEIYWPLVSSRTVWIPLEYIEPFPQLPMVVTANITQKIKLKPSKDSDPTRFELAEGASIQVVKYYPSGSEVWGQVASGGWIVLVMREKGAVKYPTSWEMQTVPPP